MQVSVEKLKAMRKSGLNIIIIQIIASVALFLLPNLLPNLTLDFIGIISIIFGAILIFITVKKPNEFVTWKSYILPVVIIGIGLFVLIYTNATLTILAWAIGTATIVKGIGTIFLKETPVQNPKFKIFGLINIAIGISIIVLANNIGEVFSYYVALILIYQTIVDLLIYADLGKIIESAGSSETVTITRS